MTGRRIGRYLLDGVIGVGSFATVHRVIDEPLDDTVVLKVLAENHSLNPEVRERFIAEGRALRRVRDPHVVTVHDIGESARQQPFLVLQHADRGTLADRVARLRGQGWTASTDDVLTVARQLAAALTAVHSARLVHRDLSPSNVLLTTDDGAGGEGSPSVTGTDLVGADERLLVSDLGMCKDLSVNSGLTVAGGTSGYRPPELESGPAVIDARADLWSLSALLRWVARDAELPAGLWHVLDRGQSERPEDRQPDALTWFAEVEAALRPDPHDEPGMPQAPTAGPSPGRRAGWWVVLAAALALGLLGGWLLRPTTPPTSTSTATLMIEGPTEAATGQTITLTLSHLGASSWTWVLPTGEQAQGRESVTLRPTGPGRATVVVHGLDDHGRPLRVEHELEVVP